MPRLACFSILCFSILFHQPILAQEHLSNDDVRDMGHTIGFSMGQNLSLDEIARMYPVLAGACELAKREFTASFGGAVTAISRALEELYSAKWNETKEQILKAIIDKSNFASLTEGQALEFIGAVRHRAKGDMEERALQTLLMWDPIHRAQPQSEFVRYRQKFVINGEGKSRGIKLQIQYPSSWASLEAERPNILRKFISERGRGSQYATVLVKLLPPAERPTKREIEEIFSASGIRDLVPPGGNFISGKRISFDGLPGAVVTFTLTADRMGQQFKLRSLMYMTFYRDNIVTLHFSTKDDDMTFMRFEPLFRLMANSTVILSQYE